RIVSGKLHLELQETDLVTLVDDALESVRPAAEAKKIEVSCSFNSAIAPTWGDPARLQQCIWNLLSNAIKFTPEGGRVQVTLHREQDRVEITVADNGIGIRPEFLPFVFDRFRQGETATTRPSGGLGLGLAIAKQLVEAHGGQIRAESAGDGQGAKVTLSIPLAPSRPPTREELADSGGDDVEPGGHWDPTAGGG